MTTQAVREMCTTERIGFTRVGHRRWLFTRKDIQDLVERNTYRAKTVYEKAENLSPKK